MSIDFAYAQARVQACLGARLSESGWRMLESTPGLAPFLAALRNSPLAPRVRHFSTSVTPHEIERALRDDWRAEVGAVARWVPEPWFPATAWTAWLPYLDAVAWLMRGEPVLAWMRDDAILGVLVEDESPARAAAIGDSPFGILADGDATGGVYSRWFVHWIALAPDSSEEEETGLRTLTAAVHAYLEAVGGRSYGPGALRSAYTRLTERAIHLVHSHAEEPVAVFCHLLLLALELQRLREGLLRRALFDSRPGEQAP